MKKTLKKGKIATILVALFALCAVVGLAACKGKSGDDAGDPIVWSETPGLEGALINAKIKNVTFIETTPGSLAIQGTVNGNNSKLVMKSDEDEAEFVYFVVNSNDKYSMYCQSPEDNLWYAMDDEDAFGAILGAGFTSYYLVNHILLKTEATDYTKTIAGSYILNKATMSGILAEIYGDSYDEDNMLFSLTVFLSDNKVSSTILMWGGATFGITYEYGNASKLTPPPANKIVYED